ncbi:SRPBCC domain-containing protein [Streptomyces sp. NPDC126522]|uniref:SRPBCC domain-containing protein n=1 Tax=Streptomyces sp. NPDC126522 TaxID=3155211 RepID=UPI003317E6E6
MEHEVHVPVPPARLRAALTDPARIARAVPGLQQDAGTEPVAGRLKVRVGSHSITYRGALRISVQDDGSYTVEGDATETRGTGSVKLALTLRVRDAGDGSAVTFDGTATADGRITELAPDAVRSATTRLLDRFAENLGADVDEQQQPEQPEPPVPAPEFGPAEADGPDAVEAPDAIEARDDIEAADDLDDVDDPDDPDDIDGIPEIADTVAGIGDIGGLDDPHVSENFGDSPVPPAEAAHARRTMIGRSAEEVDHAPPRGRYAPVPAPQSVSSSATLRWAAPAAALVVASAIVVNRVLRKRR